ncbi:hypothetical protein C5612_30405 [Pseudomonas frederiksbergensis]|uniref:Uncharacterized protein n=1 Tax=Pseudomonas frederiksbergensis TaxID=104087 RepID=A0A2S8H3U1_9PSED|nr:hypothetical protein C5612_30405 [Pseudomonas frederiksbergensis]
MAQHLNVCGTELRAEVSFVLDTLVSKSRSDREVVFMNNIIYIVGAVVIVLVILSFVGLV